MMLNVDVPFDPILMQLNQYHQLLELKNVHFKGIFWMDKEC